MTDDDQTIVDTCSRKAAMRHTVRIIDLEDQSNLRAGHVEALARDMTARLPKRDKAVLDAVRINAGGYDRDVNASRQTRLQVKRPALVPCRPACIVYIAFKNDATGAIAFCPEGTKAAIQLADNLTREDICSQSVGLRCGVSDLIRDKHRLIAAIGRMRHIEARNGIVTRGVDIAHHQFAIVQRGQRRRSARPKRNRTIRIIDQCASDRIVIAKTICANQDRLRLAANAEIGRKCRVANGTGQRIYFEHRNFIARQTHLAGVIDKGDVETQFHGFVCRVDDFIAHHRG